MLGSVVKTALARRQFNDRRLYKFIKVILIYALSKFFLLKTRIIKVKNFRRPEVPYWL
jgi:hypothetical protein